MLGRYEHSYKISNQLLIAIMKIAIFITIFVISLHVMYLLFFTINMVNRYYYYYNTLY